MEENNIFRTISHILLGNANRAQDFQAIIKEEICPKNHVLHHSGDVCHKLFYLKERNKRVFYYKEGKDITCWFSFENDIFTAIDSSFQEKKSKYCIQILEEDSVIWTIKRSDMEPLFQK